MIVVSTETLKKTETIASSPPQIFTQQPTETLINFVNNQFTNVKNFRTQEIHRCVDAVGKMSPAPTHHVNDARRTKCDR